MAPQGQSSREKEHQGEAALPFNTWSQKLCSINFCQILLVKAVAVAEISLI
jgi:hypothetical protein